MHGKELQNFLQNVFLNKLYCTVYLNGGESLLTSGTIIAVKSTPLHDQPFPAGVSLVQNYGHSTFKESVLMGNEVFFLPDDEPHLLFLEAGCPSVGVVGSDVPLNATVQSRQNHLSTF